MMKNTAFYDRMKRCARSLVSFLFSLMSLAVLVLGLIWTFRGVPEIFSHNTFLAALVIPIKFVLTIAATIFIGTTGDNLTTPRSGRRSRSGSRAYRSSRTYDSTPHYGNTGGYAQQMHRQAVDDALRMHEEAMRAHREATESFQQRQWNDQREDFGRFCSESQSNADDYARSSAYEAQSSANDFAQSSMDYTQSTANDFASSMNFGGGGFGF